ncbi:Galactose-3-O-sulfotransferase [Gracilaria domingensis]|nr:Galactose-3-O-sulfotransferase [Gracilaria domingensis]
MRRVPRLSVSNVLLLIPIVLLFAFALNVKKSGSFRALTSVEPPPHERVHRPIFYLKMHKTASTTISRALARYATRHGLSISRASGRTYITKPNPSSSRFDVIALQHMPYNLELLDTFLNGRPNMVLSSIRHPTDRAVSWFRQQITKFERVSQRDCAKKEGDILKEFDEFVDQGRQQASQYFQLQERTARLALHPQRMNITQLMSQFNFIFLQERLQDSFECFCKTHNVHLCDAEHPVKKENAKKKRGCVEHVLMQHRPNVLTKGYEQDLEILNWVRAELDECVKDIPGYCRCKTA